MRGRKGGRTRQGEGARNERRVRRSGHGWVRHESGGTCLEQAGVAARAGRGRQWCGEGRRRGGVVGKGGRAGGEEAGRLGERRAGWREGKV